MRIVERIVQFLVGGVLGALVWMLLMSVLALSGLVYENDGQSWLLGIGVPAAVAVAVLWGVPRINARLRTGAWSFVAGMLMALLLAFSAAFILG